MEDNNNLTGKIIAHAPGRFIKLEANKKAHYIPTAIHNNPNFKNIFSSSQRNIVELYENCIVIRPIGEGTKEYD